MSRLHSERHHIGRIGWLRAAVMGANDGIVSTSSLLVGVAAAAAGKPEVLLAGFAGLAAGALSMAAGEYVSVSSQADTENADLAREKDELAAQPEAELDELTGVYVARGLEPDLAREVARQLTASDGLAAHARDELAISDLTTARPLQAAIASAATFSVGAALPSGCCMAQPTRQDSRVRHRVVAPRTGAPRRLGVARGRSLDGQGRRARGVLGGARDGRHRRCRSPFWPLPATS